MADAELVYKDILGENGKSTGVSFAAKTGPGEEEEHALALLVKRETTENDSQPKATDDLWEWMTDHGLTIRLSPVGHTQLPDPPVMARLYGNETTLKLIEPPPEGSFCINVLSTKGKLLGSAMISVEKRGANYEVHYGNVIDVPATLTESSAESKPQHRTLQ